MNSPGLPPLFSFMASPSAPLSPEAQFLFNMFISDRMKQIEATFLPQLINNGNVPTQPRTEPAGDSPIERPRDIVNHRRDSLENTREIDRKSDVVKLFPYVVTNSPSMSKDYDSASFPTPKRFQAEAKSSKVKSLSCSFCGKIFQKTATYRTHVRIHTNERPFKCSHCDRTFTDNSNKRKHEITHSVDTPFECAFCKKRFKAKAYLTKHLKVCNVKDLKKRRRNQQESVTDSD